MLLTTELSLWGEGERAMVLRKESSTEPCESPQPRQARLYVSLASSWEVLRELDGAVTSLGVWLPVAVKSQAKMEIGSMDGTGRLPPVSSAGHYLCLFAISEIRAALLTLDEKASQRKTTSASIAPPRQLWTPGVSLGGQAGPGSPC